MKFLRFLFYFPSFLSSSGSWKLLLCSTSVKFRPLCVCYPCFLYSVKKSSPAFFCLSLFQHLSFGTSRLINVARINLSCYVYCSWYFCYFSYFERNSMGGAFFSSREGRKPPMNSFFFSSFPWPRVDVGGSGMSKASCSLFL